MSTQTDQTLFSEDVISYIPALRAYAWTLTRRHQDVDDLVQETLTKAIANVHRFRPGTNLRAWLMTIMRNTFYNEIVKTKRERPGGEDCVSGTASVPSTQEWALRGSELMSAISRLPGHYRETLILVVMLGESYETAADICGVAIGTIKSRVNRARVMVIEELGEKVPERL
ncbi:sigma-70 family RNA polymerase sigma factor [Salipiger marinus]|uniref:sigma-70 family RNA polymerase sigma factor n=1 Tax=Salipiger marinus TaxID=555512 RepID=UPI000E89C79C|nr:sigma-70 family RNA polymerase sigma factor [Salipiger manganoxidans]MCD1618560.1 sigma-70 family RNA polymerase sigma factor [Salipiger manganoxidans]MEB3417713.1 sigma-70 family RNA polymerase sigma factor [Salipiger manganoxidans]HBS98417.1 RNA polymerase subunit sigma [Citreicella sp.]